MVFFALLTVFANEIYENINPFLYIILLIYCYYDLIVKSRALRLKRLIKKICYLGYSSSYYNVYIMFSYTGSTYFKTIQVYGSEGGRSLARALLFV